MWEHIRCDVKDYYMCTRYEICVWLVHTLTKTIFFILFIRCYIYSESYTHNTHQVHGVRINRSQTNTISRWNAECPFHFDCGLAFFVLSTLFIHGFQCERNNLINSFVHSHIDTSYSKRIDRRFQNSKYFNRLFFSFFCFGVVVVVVLCIA